MQREDGRTNLQHRRIGVEIDRDVLFSFGLTKVHTALEYSSQLKKGISLHVIIETNAVPPTLPGSRIEKISEDAEKAVESIFEGVLLDKENSYMLTCRVLCDNGSMLSAIINSVSLTLLSYKVPIKYMIFSVTVGLSVYRHLEYIVDLSDSEIKSDIPYITLAMPHIAHEKIISYGALSKPLSEKAFVDLLEFSTTVLPDICRKIVEKSQVYEI